MVEDLEAMDNHLEGLTALALKNDELKDNIAWTIAQLAKQLVFMSKIEEAEAIIKRALIISPGDENILQIQKEIDNKGAIQESFHALSDDGSVQETVRHLIELEIFYNKMNPFEVMQRELLEDYLELIILEDIQFYRKSIKILKEQYPELYALKKEFFNGTADIVKRNQMLKKLRKQKYKFEALSLMLDEESPFAGDEDEDEYEDDYFTEEPYIREEPKIGRNDPCPCGSGKKYKKCCGK